MFNYDELRQQLHSAELYGLETLIAAAIASSYHREAGYYDCVEQWFVTTCKLDKFKYVSEVTKNKIQNFLRDTQRTKAIDARLMELAKPLSQRLCGEPA